MYTRLKVIGIAVTVVLTVGLTASPAESQVEEFTGIISSTGFDAGLTQFRLRIEQYSTEEEGDELLRVLVEEGPQSLEQRLLDVERARLIPSGELGHNIGYANSEPTGDGGRIIHLLSARPLFLFESVENTFSREYPFGVIEITLDAEGKGSGSVFAAARILFEDDGRIVIQSFDRPPYSIPEIQQN